MIREEIRSPAMTVFLIDADASARDIASRVVSRMDVNLRCYESAEEFLEDRDESQPGCLVTELHLPRMGGLELLTALADSERTLPTIIVTDFADVPAAVEAMQRGALTVVEKPCRELVLWNEIQNALLVEAETRETRNRRRTQRNRISELTDQERRIMDLIVMGHPNKRIASRFDVSIRTVEDRRKNIYRKTGSNCVADLVRLACEAEQPHVSFSPRRDGSSPHRADRAVSPVRRSR